MAEFSEVMRQAKRMCKVIDSCSECPLRGVFKTFRCPFDYPNVELTDIEKPVMDWATENPELRYPTWTEWQEANFPDVTCCMCPRVFGYSPEEGCANISCKDCAGRSIPAEIAEKLGIKPIGGRDE